LKNLLIALAALALVAAVVYFAVGGDFSALGLPQLAPAATSTRSDPVLPAITTRQSGKLMADAKVVPVRTATLNAPAAGIVESVTVAEGDKVKAGQVLVRWTRARQEATVAQAEAALRRAQARLVEAKAGPRAPEIVAAEASLAAAQAALQRLQEGPEESQLIAARADLANAEAVLQQAQAAYDKVRGSPDIASRPESLQLQQATNSRNAAKARLDSLQSRPSPAAVAAAEADIKRAQAQLDLVKLGPRAETIAVVETEVLVSTAEVNQAKVSLAETEIRAPFDASVVAVLAGVGEYSLLGAPMVRLADLSAWLIETDDVTELDIVRISEGDKVTITFDGISGLELAGQVLRIKAVGETKQGDVTYTVVIKPDQVDNRLRWNMTASVAFDVKE
jgi:multidrug efflux pump subunit AcrA (membrane-fusion protein)